MMEETLTFPLKLFVLKTICISGEMHKFSIDSHLQMSANTNQVYVTAFSVPTVGT